METMREGFLSSRISNTGRLEDNHQQWCLWKRLILCKATLSSSHSSSPGGDPKCRNSCFGAAIDLRICLFMIFPYGSLETKTKLMAFWEMENFCSPHLTQRGERAANATLVYLGKSSWSWRWYLTFLSTELMRNKEQRRR